MTCTHERTLSIGAKCSDMCWVRWPNGETSDGYAPNIEGLDGGDYVDFTVCIDCKVILKLADADDILALQPEPKPPPPPPTDVTSICQVCGSSEPSPDCPACEA